MLGRIFLGRYETIKQLGEGGMGRVYLAKQTDLGRHVVVKVMHDHIANDPKFKERFQRETLLMARFQHPYVVALYDASLTDPQGPCIVMEYIRGITLDVLLQRNQRLMPARVGRLLGQLCEALQAAHGMGIVHRDLKPANLMVVDPDTPYEKIKVMDFGLAKLVESKLHHKGTDTGTDFAVGTPGYISPEQVRGDEMDHRSDLYSVGVILFELLTGRLPFAGEETMDVLLKHATEEPPAFSQIGATGLVPSAVEAVVRRCLAKKPNERPASARDLAEQFQDALAQLEDMGDGVPGPDETLTVETSISQPTPVPFDPHVVVHHMEAWMPEAIAKHKLNGFVQDAGGEIIESVPGRVRVRLGGKGSPYALTQGPFSWFGLGKRTVDMELRLERNNPQQQSLLKITVLMHAPDSRSATSPDFRVRCNQIFCDLRGYLAGSSVGNG